MRRVLSLVLTLTLAAGFVTPRLQPVPATQAESPSERIAAASDVEGRGWASLLGCVGCVGAGMYILTSGATAVLAAASSRGSAFAVATCAGMCRDAIG